MIQYQKLITSLPPRWDANVLPIKLKLQGAAINDFMRDLSSGLVELHAGELAPSLRERGCDLLCNAVASAAPGMRHPIVKLLAEAPGQHEGGKSAYLLWTDKRSTPLAAASAHAAAISVYAFDDFHLSTLIHPAATVLAALLAQAVEVGSDGPSLLRAFALGCEATLRFGLAIQPSHYEEGWHATATCGLIGATVSSCLLAGFGPLTLRSALTIAAGQIGGRRAFLGRPVRALNTARAAQAGLASAWLAAGATEQSDVFRSSNGIFALLSREPAYKQKLLTDGLGDLWHIRDVHPKLYPCGLLCFPAIHAALGLRRRLGADEIIVGVEVNCSPLAASATDCTQPDDGAQAALSIQHAVATAMIEGCVGLRHYTDESVREPLVAALRERIHVASAEHLADDECLLQVSTTHRILTGGASGLAPRSETSRNLQLETKITECLPPGGGDAAGLRAIVNALDAGLASVDDLMVACCGASDESS